MESESASCFTESEDASSVTAQEVFDLQQRILEQSAEIEKYIESHKKSSRKQSESFAFLQSLFTIFKSEVSMNLSFRKAIVRERKLRMNAEQSQIDAEHFFSSLTQLSKHQISSFSDASNFVASLLEEHAETKRSLQKANQQLKQAVKHLEDQIASQDEKLNHCAQDKSNHDEIVKKLKSRLNAAVCEAEGLKVELNEAKRVVEKQRKAIHQQVDLCCESKRSVKKEREAIKRNLRQSQDDIEAREKTLQAALDERDNEWKVEIDKLHDELEQAVNDMKKQHEEELEKEKKKQSEIELDLKQQLIRQQNEKQVEVEERNLALEKKDTEINDLKKKVAELSQTVQSLTEQVEEKNSAIESGVRKLEYVTAQSQETAAKNAQLQKIKEEQENRIDQLVAEVGTLKSDYEMNRRRLVCKIKSIKQKHKADVSTLSEEIEKRLIAKMKAIESDIQCKEQEISQIKSDLHAAQVENAELEKSLSEKETQLKKQRSIVGGFQQENERLRNMMREKSDAYKLNEAVFSEFRKLYDILQVEPSSPPDSITETVAYLTAKRRRHH